MSRLTFSRFAAPVLVAVALGLSACGGSDDAEQADATVPQTTRSTTPTTPVTTPTTTVPTQTTTTPAQPPQTTATQPPATTPTTPQQNGGATTPARPRTTPSQQTGGATGPSPCGNVAGGFISGVQASGTACGEATSVANDWLGQVGESGPEADVVAGGYACSGRRSGDATAITCIAEGGRRVTFSANN